MARSRASRRFPATNLGQESVRKVFDKASQYPGLRGVMGNNQLMLLQFPRTYYFFATAWDKDYENRPEPDVMLDLAAQLYPDHKQLIADSFLALRETDSDRIDRDTRQSWRRWWRAAMPAVPERFGRLLFPDQLAVARNLQMQLEIRAARQTFLKALRGKPDVSEVRRLVEKLLRQAAGLEQGNRLGQDDRHHCLAPPIYEEGKDLTEAMYRLKQILAEGAPYTSYAQGRCLLRRRSAKIFCKSTARIQ